MIVKVYFKDNAFMVRESHRKCCTSKSIRMVCATNCNSRSRCCTLSMLVSGYLCSATEWV